MTRTRKEPEFIRPIAVGQCILEKIAQLILKNFYRIKKTLSRAWFCELLSDWSKTLFESQDLVNGHKVKKYVLTHTPTLGQ